MFVDTKATASLLDRPAYFAAHPASIGMLWTCESTVLSLAFGESGK
jgi:hypothetical protein